jgi:transposase-like protein
MKTNTATKPRLPKTLLEAVRYFSDLDVCTEYVARLRWPSGPVCPRCEGQEHSYLKTRRVWKCKSCKRQFSVKVGTIFEQSPIGLDKWLPAVWLLANSKNGVSSHELARAVGITQKSAWHVLHRVREAMRNGSFDRFDGETEVDETFVGGRVRNMHRSVKKAKGLTHAGPWDKTIVAGALRRTNDDGPSQVRAQVVKNTRHGTLQKYVHATVEPGSVLYTDAHASYHSLRGEYDHRVIDHAEIYVDGQITTNGIGNFWSLLKRGLTGTYVQVAPEHLGRYLDERIFTFNEREQTDLARFDLVLQQSVGRRVTWTELTSR